MPPPPPPMMEELMKFGLFRFCSSQQSASSREHQLFITWRETKTIGLMWQCAKLWSWSLVLLTWATRINTVWLTISFEDYLTADPMNKYVQNCGKDGGEIRGTKWRACRGHNVRHGEREEGWMKRRRETLRHSFRLLLLFLYCSLARVWQAGRDPKRPSRRNYSPSRARLACNS